VKIDAEENLMLVCGAVPGPKGSYILIRKSRKAKKAAQK
jgi:ribosomal protein L3